MNKVKEIRRMRGFSQLEIAERTNIAPCDLSRIENGHIKAYPTWRRRLATALRCEESELFPPKDGQYDDG